MSGSAVETSSVFTLHSLLPSAIATMQKLWRVLFLPGFFKDIFLRHSRGKSSRCFIQCWVPSLTRSGYDTNPKKTKFFQIRFPIPGVSKFRISPPRPCFLACARVKSALRSGRRASQHIYLYSGSLLFSFLCCVFFCFGPRRSVFVACKISVTSFLSCFVDLIHLIDLFFRREMIVTKKGTTVMRSICTQKQFVCTVCGGACCDRSVKPHYCPRQPSDRSPTSPVLKEKLELLTLLVIQVSRVMIKFSKAHAHTHTWTKFFIREPNLQFNDCAVYTIP
jgi:hypothetical protein